jgi:hypothetical protein
LSGLLLLGAAYALLRYYQGLLGRPPSSLYPFLAGVCLGWNVATRYAELLFVPIFGLLLLYYWYTAATETRSTPLWPLPRSLWQPLVAFGLPLALTGLGLIVFNIYRYGDALDTGYLPNETFSGIWLDGILGQLISPGRGLLVYSPILILSFVGLIPFFRRFRAEAVVTLSVIVGHLLLYGKWFMWHGGYAWGPRFMIPTLAFWAMFLAPVADRAFSPAANRIASTSSAETGSVAGPTQTQADLAGLSLRVIYITLIVFSLIPQILSNTIDFTPFQNALLDTGLPLFDRETFFSLRFAPLLEAWTFIRLDRLDLAWAWQGQTGWGLLTLLVINIAVTGYYFWRVSTAKTPGSRLVNSSAFVILPLASTTLALVFLLRHTHGLPGQPLRESVSVLNEVVRPVDVVITNDPAAAGPFAELYKGRAPVLGLNSGGFPLATDISDRLAQVMSDHRQLWWLPNWLPPGESAVEQTLLVSGFRARNEDFQGQRLVLFTVPPASSDQVRAVEANFGGLLTLTEVAYAPNGSSGSALPVELRWEATTALGDDYHVFVHLINGQDKIIAQADGQPAEWSRPTSSWPVGETVIDRHGLWIPAEAAAGAYQLRVGVYNPADGNRLRRVDGTDSARFEVTID